MPASISAPAPTERPWRTLAKRGAATALIGLVIAVMFTLLEVGNFPRQLLYSMCVSFSCWVCVDGGRALVALALHKLNPQHPSAAHGWPGWWWMGACVVLGVAIGYTFGTTVGDLITGLRSRNLLTSDWRGYGFVMIFSLGVALAFTYFITTREELIVVRADAEAARRVAAEHQLKLLEAQLEPHMLFNTLANLRALIAVDPPRAQAMLDRLIAFLRATLTASRVGMHPLSAEFERLADYLALMHIRMGDRLQIELDLPQALASHPVPALLLQPLVENAIKHGLEPHRGGGRVTVAASQQGEQLCLRVQDTGAGLKPGAVSGTSSDISSQGTGFGTQQVRERLATVYGASARFSLEAAPGGGTLALLLLPLEHQPKRQSA